MSEIIVTNVICNALTKLLSDAFGDIEFSGNAPPVGGTGDLVNQINVVMSLDDDEMREPLESFTEDFLKPAAHALAMNLQRRNAVATYHLELPDRAKQYDVTSHTARYNGMSARCIVKQPDFKLSTPQAERGMWVVRFDVVFRSAVQAAEVAA